MGAYGTRLGALAVACGLARVAFAQAAPVPPAPPVEAPAPAEEEVVPEFHGFVSPGYVKSWGNDYLARDSSTRGSFEFAEAGFNLTVPLGERLRTGTQLFVRDLGPIGKYQARFDWFYLDYRWMDWLGLRAGRTKIPFGLYNELSDSDPALQTVLLPQSIYPLMNRDFLLAQTGLELYGYHPLPSAGALDYRLYAGTIFIPIEETFAASEDATINSADTPYLVGGRLIWELPFRGLRLGASGQALRLDLDATLGGMEVSARIPAVLWVGSAEYVLGDLTLATEYSRWYVTIEATPPVVPGTQTISERGYLLASYGVTSWFRPGAYYALTFPDVSDRTGKQQRQHDLALSLRFDLMAHWLLKLEGHLFEGTADLDAELNEGPASGRPGTWGALLLKTTAYF